MSKKPNKKLKVWIGRDRDGKLALFDRLPDWVDDCFQGDESLQKITLEPSKLRAIAPGELYTFSISLKKVKK